MKYRSLSVSLIITLLFSTACAEKKVRLWISPPIGYEAPNKETRNLYYKVEDAQSGKKESLMIPLNQLPENLVVEEHRTRGGVPGTTDSTYSDNSASVTQADQVLNSGKLPAAAEVAPSISYLRGLQEINALYERHQYNEALIKVTPLLTQYPKQARLFKMQGTLYRKIGEKKMAYLAFKRAFELDKNDSKVEEALLKTEAELGETNE